MSGAATVRRGLLPIAVATLALTAVAAVATHAQHVDAGYALDREMRRGERLTRERDLLLSVRAEATAPARVRERAERLGLELAVPTDGRDASIDLDALIRRDARSEEWRPGDVVGGRGIEGIQRTGGAR